MNRLLLALLPAIALVACSSEEDAGQGSDNLTGEGTTADVGLDVTTSGHLVLDRSSLGKRVYRLAATAIYAHWDTECGPQPADYKAEPPGDVPDTCFYTIYPIGTRRVTFTEAGNKLLMREQGDEGTIELGSFAISESTESAVEFAFEPDTLHAQRNLANQGAKITPKLTNSTFRTRKAAGWVAVQQDARLSLAGTEVPGRVKWGLQAEPAHKTAFEPSFQTDGARYLFEVNGPKHPVAKLDFTNKQVVRLRNVGAPDARLALADKTLAAAVDYWNRVFRAASGEKERDFFAVDSSTEKAFAHDPGFNVVQWMSYPLNGTSTGVFQNDLTTGETLFGNAHISAGFFGNGEKEGRALYKLAHGQTAPKEAVDRFLADYMLETVAHELGHVLGLQHDFEASNVGQGLTPDDLPRIAKDYFASADAPAEISISVMEYLPSPLVGLLGGRMRKNVLPHDLRAVALAYFGKKIDLAKTFSAVGEKAAALPYCNDDDLTAGPAPTCATFDHPLCVPPSATATSLVCFPGEDEEKTSPPTP